MTTETLSKTDLAQFTGSENWYRHGINRSVLYTDGAQYVAEQGGPYWLLDPTAIAQRIEKRVAAEEFQLWKLTVRSDRTASLVVGCFPRPQNGESCSCCRLKSALALSSVRPSANADGALW